MLLHVVLHHSSNLCRSPKLMHQQVMLVPVRCRCCLFQRSGVTGPGEGAVTAPAPHRPTVACYVCQLPSIPGRFLPAKAAELGVARGPLWGQLKAGKPAAGTGGRMVQPHEVRTCLHARS